MLSRLLLFVQYFFFWLVYFLLAKIFFLVFHYENTLTFPVADWFRILWHGLRLDLSATGWFVLIPGLALSLTAYAKPLVPRAIITAFTMAMIVVTTLIIVGDAELYRYWGFRMDHTPIMYLSNPSEVLGSVQPSRLLLIVALEVGWIALAIFLFLKLFQARFRALKKSDWKTALLFIPVTASMIIFIRGGVDVANMNLGTAYFHTRTFANHAAINVVWNVGISLNYAKETNYPEDYFDREKTEKLFSKIYSSPESDSTIGVLRSERPNIVLIVLESFTAKGIGALGGHPNATPNLNKLAKEGILFDHFYSSGDRTDKGLVSILSGYPAQPKSSIVKYSQKTETLPYLSKDLEKLGYHLSFTSGHNMDYSNFRSYFTNGHFTQITEKDDYPSEQYGAKWGVHDEFTFLKSLEELRRDGKEKQPFFKMIMTLSSHEPFDVPMEPVIKGTSEDSLFLNSMYYTDKWLGHFIREAKKESWWENTLMIMVADHGVRRLGIKDNHDPEKFRIPMLWVGGALAVTDTVITKYGNQTDLPPTVLAQLGIDSDHYRFGQNLLSNGSKGFSTYIYNNGVGLVTDSSTVVYDNNGKRFVLKTGAISEETENLGRAYLQEIFLDFNKRGVKAD